MMLRFILVASLCLFPLSVKAQTTANEQIGAILDLIKKKNTLKIDATTVQTAIDVEDYELQRMAVVSIAVSIDQEAANAIIAGALKADGRFANPKFAFSDQSIDGTIQYVGTLSLRSLGSVDIQADLHARLTPAVQLVTDGPTVDFKVGFAVSTLEVKNLRVSRNKEPLPSLADEIADAVVNSLLSPAQALLNRIELRIPTSIAATIDIKPPPEKGISVSFEPSKISPKVQIATLTYLIDKGRLIILAQESGTLNAVAAKPKNVPFATFRDSIQKTVATAGPSWINGGQLSFYVDRQLLTRLVSAMLGQGPNCIQAALNGFPAPFATKLKLPPVESIDCTPTRDCTPTKDCNQTADCSQHGECRACLLRVFGHCTQMGNDPACEARKSAAKGACEAEKARRKAQCELDKAANKASCEAAKSSEKGACETMKESYKRIRATGSEFANVDSKDLVLSGNATACVSNLTLDSETLALKGSLSVQSTVKANGHVNFTPLNVVGHVLCFAPFAKSVDDSVQVPAQPVSISTTATFLDNSDAAMIEANVANPIHIHFPFRAIASKLATDPDFIIKCPIPAIAGTIRAATPDDWWPSAVRGDIEKDIPSWKIDLDLVRKPIRLGNLRLAGALRSNKTGIGGVFKVVK
jgi:hypothetical protein